MELQDLNLTRKEERVTHHNPTEMISVSQLKPGDTVIIDGIAKTLGREYIKHCSFMGSSVYGDCRALEGRKIEVMLFPKWYKGKIVNYVRQP
jgi:hypothetical protein